jgi:hypothetical protein
MVVWAGKLSELWDFLSELRSSVCLLVRVTVVDKNRAVVCCLLATSAIIATHHVTRHNTPIHNILPTAPQFSISQKALGIPLKMAM